MSFKIVWKPEQLEQVVKANAAQRLQVAAIHLTNVIKQDLSAPSPPVSAPGTSPHKELGRLRASINNAVDKDKLVARVGTNVTYGKFLELGTRHMEARPFLRKNLNEQMPTLKKIIGG